MHSHSAWSLSRTPLRICRGFYRFFTYSLNHLENIFKFLCPMLFFSDVKAV